MEEYTLDEFMIILDEYNSMNTPESERKTVVSAENF